MPASIGELGISPDLLAGKTSLASISLLLRLMALAARFVVGA
ncbi:MAG TPA: hypothetical protein PLJ35_15285 [Anaerolineae bacterium]|nr:hypothetical protein [Anaerolineae bacterium]HOR00176.1 hypothetical protein [Anaerolineae bacterium]HPL28759.1 hypothetical protein [Anaerolineae bacterium]